MAELRVGQRVRGKTRKPKAEGDQPEAPAETPSEGHPGGHAEDDGGSQGDAEDNERPFHGLPPVLQLLRAFDYGLGKVRPQVLKGGLLPVQCLSLYSKTMPQSKKFCARKKKSLPL